MGLARPGALYLPPPPRKMGENWAGAWLFYPTMTQLTFGILEGGDQWVSVSPSHSHSRIHYDSWRHFVRTDSEKYMP